MEVPSEAPSDLSTKQTDYQMMDEREYIEAQV